MSDPTVERLAIELRQIEAEDAAGTRQPACTRQRNWSGASEWLKDEYRRTARRLLRVIRDAKPTNDPEGQQP